MSAAALAVRSCALLALGLTAALVAESWPAGGAASETDLPSVSDAGTLRAEDPVMRLAAALPQRPIPSEPARAIARPAAPGQP
jgi:hypothetical protein